MNSFSLSGRFPAPRLVTARLVLRCYAPEDAPLLKDALDSSLEHLCPWLPWVKPEPRPLEEHADNLRNIQRGFQKGEKHVYGIFDATESTLLGGTGIHPVEGESAVKEIGYWLRASATGRGYARESVAAMVLEAFRVFPIGEVMIRCDARNGRSAAAARALGFRHAGNIKTEFVPSPWNLPGRAEDMVWRMARSERFPRQASRAREPVCFPV